MKDQAVVKDQDAADKDHVPTSTTVDEAEPKMESLSSKISNLPVLNGSLQTVSKTCKDIKESNSYVKYGLDIAGSSLDKAMQAGKSVLDSSTLSPVTTKAIENIHFLDKEAGVIVDKFFGTKTESECRESEGLQKNGSLQTENGIQELAENNDKAMSKDLSKKESTTDYLSRKLFEITSFLFSFPKTVIVSFLHLFQFTPESTRKRKERGSISEELQKLEPSPVKRKYGDRKSSSDEGSLVEMLLVNENYVSEEDSDYVPHDNDLGDTDEELTESDEEEIAKEAEDLKLDLKDREMLLLSSNKKINRRKVDNLESKDLKKGGENNDQSCPITKDVKLCSTTAKQECPNPGKTEKSAVLESTKTNEKEPLKSSEITPIENTNTTKVKTAESKENDASKEGKSTTPGKEISPSTKTRKSSKSPLLGKLLSSRRSEKGKEKSNKEISDKTKSEKSEKAEKFEKNEKSEKAKKSEKAEKFEKNEKSENLEKTTKSEKAKKSEKSEISEKPTPADQNLNDNTNPPMSVVSGPFDVFKMGGKSN